MALDGETAIVTGGSSGTDRCATCGPAERSVLAAGVVDVREGPKDGGQPTHEPLVSAELRNPRTLRRRQRVDDSAMNGSPSRRTPRKIGAP